MLYLAFFLVVLFVSCIAAMAFSTARVINDVKIIVQTVSVRRRRVR